MIVHFPATVFEAAVTYKMAMLNMHTAMSIPPHMLDARRPQ